MNVRFVSGYLAHISLRFNKLKLSGFPFTSNTCNSPLLQTTLKSLLYLIGNIFLPLYSNLSWRTYSTWRVYDKISPDSKRGSMNSCKNKSSVFESYTMPLYVRSFFPFSEISTWYLDVFLFAISFHSFTQQKSDPYRIALSFICY